MVADKGKEKIIQIIGIAIPVAVAVLLGIRQKIDLGLWTRELPHWIGAINATTALFLILAFIAVKMGQIQWHERFNRSAFMLGAIFLVLYILYHLSNESTSSSQMPQTTRYIYLFLLITHIGLSIVVVRYVLYSMYYAMTKQIDLHKKIVKITFPLWLYVSISGVLVYLMISPYYASN